MQKKEEEKKINQRTCAQVITRLRSLKADLIIS